ncbi:MAG: 50S ribosomal protein L11 methyltransferase [Betaproteobacteria bacterium]|jgi:SAM-dependent methyltransferase|nr:50S ribosomal protein L11 methyltransferase [Betaproteobacteria bacterium]
MTAPMRLSPIRIACAACVLAAGLFTVVAGVAGTVHAQPVERAPLRAPDIHYEPTPHNVVTEILDLAKIGARDVVYDLGCGDGRIVIAAVKQRGARGVCVDIDPQRIRESKVNAARAGVAERIVFLNQDLFETDLAGATVITLFLSRDVNRKLRPKLTRELEPGTRVISYVHDMGAWAPTASRTVQGAYGPRNLNLWIIAPRK